MTTFPEWGLEPGIVIPVFVLGALYWRGLARVRLAAPRAVPGRGVASFVAGYVVLIVALVSPLHGMSEELFSAHMLQHELLMALAAPLLVLGRPGPVLLWAFDRPSRLRVASVIRASAVRKSWHWATRPFDAWLIHAIAIWAWHIPLLFQSTLHSEAAHALQHASFLGSALLFWWSIMHGLRRAERGMAIVYLFTTAVHTAVLGALMTFAHSPWYPEYVSGAASWGLTPMADQQLAGLIMWVPASAAYLVAALAVMRAWLRDSEWAVSEAERVSPSLSS
ncbi:MAG TPA: cytochrome c oxidase assembly protein [Gemmatimonadaceae bacterium]|nr:cytochrome c oxidase assembly protein [Gemmatimonadaceae bacterium]